MRVPQSELNKSKEHIRGRQVLQETKAVRPKREDGYTNVLNKYGTSHDNSEAYTFEREQLVPDMQLTSLYEGNGLFSKIIDTPAEEALKHGFDLNLKNDELVAFTEEALDDLDWEEKAATAIKWARLYGGAIIVMLIDDGKGLEEPVDWQNIRSIDELRVFERAVVQPDYTSLYMQDFGNDGKKNRTSRFGEPEFYYVNSMFGSFKVHESRCLVFKNGTLPEQVSNTTYQMWGMPEYIRIKRALRETTTAHTDAVKLLERSVQAIYSMKNLAQLLATDDGEGQVLKRLEIIDMARGLLNSIAIDAEGESYDFKTFQFSGVKDVIESTCNMLSALTNIPQTLLFGRSPSGMDATGMSDLENYYNFVERIQKLMLKRNFRYLLDVIYRAGVASGELMEEPDYKLSFNPLWSMSETEQATVDQTRAATALAKAQTAQIYVDMQAIDPTEVRRKLASDEDFDVEDIVEEDDNDLYNALFGNAESEAEAVEKNAEQTEAAGGAEQSSAGEPLTQPPTTALAQDADDIDWITVNGTHIPLDENGTALGGFAKGAKFSEAKTWKHPVSTLTKNASKLIREKDEDYKCNFLNECGVGYRDITKALQNGKLDDVVDEELKKIDQARKTVADKAPDNQKTRKSAQKDSVEIRNEQVEILVSYDEEGNEIGRIVGTATEVDNTQKAAYATLHNHPNDTVSCFSGNDVHNLAKTNEQVMYMTAMTKLYSLQKTSDADRSSVDAVGTHLNWIEKKYHNGEITRDELIAEADLYLQLHAHEHGLVYKQQDAESHADADMGAKDEIEPNTVGCLIIKDGKVLTGIRKSDFHPFTICGAGGHIEQGETPEQAAIRETQEEFGITPKNITPIGIRTGLPEEYGVPMYFIATDYDGDVHCDDHSEMVAPQLSDLGEVLKAVQGGNDNLFLPFADSFDMLNEVLYQEVNNPQKDVEFSQNVLPYRKKSAIIETSGADDFNESDHPRDENGQFTEGGGGSGGQSGEPKGFSVGSKSDLDAAVKSGRAKMKLKASAQSKHHAGSKKYNDAIAQGKKVSTLSIPDDEVQSLVTSKSGTGTVYVNRKTGQLKETIDCGKPVGEYVSMSGKKSQTTRLTVHHSKDGYHAVPASSGGKPNEQ